MIGRRQSDLQLTEGGNPGLKLNGDHVDLDTILGPA